MPVYDSAFAEYWTIRGIYSVPVEDRTEYLNALDRASIDLDASPFAKFIAERVRWPLKKAIRPV
jgi:hypothetical protein